MKPRTRRKSITFTVKGEPGMDVYVAGTFNNWNPSNARLRDKMGDGVYARRILFAPGRHEYKFVINGDWRIDSECDAHVPNEHGSLNSVVTVG